MRYHVRHAAVFSSKVRLTSSEKVNDIAAKLVNLAQQLFTLQAVSGGVETERTFG